MPTYENVREETRRFGRNSYAEVARKRTTENGETTDFILVSRGLVNADGAKVPLRFVPLPDDDALKAWLADALRRV